MKAPNSLLCLICLGTFSWIVLAHHVRQMHDTDANGVEPAGFTRTWSDIVDEIASLDALEAPALQRDPMTLNWTTVLPPAGRQRAERRHQAILAEARAINETRVPPAMPEFVPMTEKTPPAPWFRRPRAEPRSMFERSRQYAAHGSSYPLDRDPQPRGKVVYRQRKSR